MGVDRTAVSGAVLCGGASRRMGRDKATLPFGEGSLIEHAVACLDEVAGTVLLACGPEPRHAELGRPLALDPVGDAGPLGGLAAALERAPTERVCVLACDLPHASGAVFERLLARAAADDADVCCLAGESGLEPLYGVYHKRCLPAVRAALARGERRMTAFHGGAVRVSVLALDELPAEHRRCAVNLNTPAEYEQERPR